MKKLIVICFALSMLVGKSALASCGSGAPYAPFNCTTTTSFNAADLVAGGSNTGATAGKTVQFTGAQIAAFVQAYLGINPYAGAFTTLNVTGAVTFTGLPATGTPVAALGVDSGGNLIKCAGANCYAGGGGGGATITLSGDCTGSGTTAITVSCATDVTNTYTASGAIAATDSWAWVSCTAACTMTLGTPTQVQVQQITNGTAFPVTITGNIMGVSGASYTLPGLGANLTLKYSLTKNTWAIN